MTSLPITGLYAALLGFLLVILLARVILLRGRSGVYAGDGGGGGELHRRIRIHGNFIETAPFGLILLGLCEAANLSIYALHLLGLCLLVGRIAHAVALSPERHIYPLRALSMILTILPYLAMSVWLLVRYVQGMGIH